MSLILDALKRAERERSGERSAALADVPGVPPQESSRWGRRIALVVVALIAGAVAWSTVRPARKPKPAVPVPEIATEAAREIAPPAPVAAAPPAPAPQKAPPQPQVQLRPQRTPDPAPIQARPAAPQVIPGTESVASLDDVQSEEDVAAQAPPPAPEVAPPLPLPSTPAPEPVPGKPAPEPPAEAAPEARPAVPDNIPPALTQQAPMRRLREMPPEYRADFPAINVEVHVFERAPAQRFVLVNGRRYRQGERMSEGPQIVEIVQEGLVLEYRGEKILYPLGR